VPNALDSEKFAPPEENVITDNDVFWNNFNYYTGAPFKLRKQATATPYRIGVGVLLFGGRHDTVINHRVYGNYLVGVGALKQVLLKQKSAADLIGNTVRDNQFGLGGTDLNGRELFYDGSGTDNCFGPNVGVQNTTPANGSTFAACPFTGTNAFDAAAQSEAINWSVGDPTHEAFWIAIRTRRRPASRRWSTTPSDAPTRFRPRRCRGFRRGAGAGRHERGRPPASEEEGRGLRQLLRPEEADRESEVADHVAVERGLGRRP
jgi:hypothetical protein